MCVILNTLKLALKIGFVLGLGLGVHNISLGSKYYIL